MKFVGLLELFLWNILNASDERDIGIIVGRAYNDNVLEKEEVLG